MNHRRLKLGFITGSRSEWPLIEPIFRAARERPDLDARLIVAGSHLSDRDGRSVDAIRAAGFEPDVCIEPNEARHAPCDIARATGRMLAGFADWFDVMTLDWVVVAGDRYEAFAAASAASILGLPIAHVAGGETDVATNYDGNLRNAITKLAHVHFVANRLAAARVLATGEEPWRVKPTGLPSLDGLDRRGVSRDELIDGGLIPEDGPFILASYFPVTMQPAESRRLLDVWLEALGLVEAHKVIILANADAGADEYAAAIKAWAANRKDASLAASLPVSVYLGALREAACYAGNSSSGLIETPLLGTPAVMVGTRQQGRAAGANAVVLPNPTVEELAAAIREQVAHGPWPGRASPWGDGAASGRICEHLVVMRTNPDLLIKRIAGAQAEARRHESTKGRRGTEAAAAPIHETVGATA